MRAAARGSFATAAAILIGLGLLAHAGQLTPPAGSVAPTMKTLDEISAQISSIQVAGGAAPVKRVIRGVIDFAQGDQEMSQTFAPAIDPVKSVVTLSNATAVSFNSSSTSPTMARSNACLIDLAATQITVRVDASITLMTAKVSYQIVEYN
jgi:hypothetical protein